MKYNYLGTSVYYKIVGKGQPIVFLHGWQSSLGSFSVLEEQLKNSYKLIFIDFPPFGKSSNLNFAWDINTYSNMVVSLLQSLKIQNFYILAHSFGGRVAINICSCYNCNVKKLILTGSAGLKPRRSLMYYIKVKRYKKLKRKQSNKASINLNNYGSQDYKALSSLMKQTFVKVVNFDQKNQAKKIKIPTLIIYGEKDKETPISMARKFNKYIKNSRLEIIKNSAHFCFLEKPEIFYDKVIHFLKNN